MTTKELKKQAREFFKQNKQVSCPAFPKETISFTSKGLNHLFYEGSMTGRPAKETETRVLLLPRALKVLEKITLWQEEWGNVQRRHT